jgi:hypothetical protein
MTAINDPKLADIDLGKLNISPDDKPTIKLLMLLEGTYGIGVEKSIRKYGYSEQRYYQLRKAFMEKGSDALSDMKRGPHGNHVRTEEVDKLIVRMKYLDPGSGAAVIAQKLNQQGIGISVRSVERAITEYGLQKKTP